eukprot:Partr_v1_DN28439_c0_g1_i4_m41392 putative chromatin remodeling complex subunit (Arp5)
MYTLFSLLLSLVSSNLSSPCIVEFENQLAKVRDRSSGKLELVLGQEAVGEKSARSPFEPATNIVLNADMMEATLDHIFSQLGIDMDAGIDHPVVFTEPPCVPTASRQILLDLLFEKYRVRSVVFGIDCLFSYASKQPSLEAGLIISVGHHSTHLVPVLNGHWIVEHTKRISVGGALANEFLISLLFQKYPEFPHKLSVFHAQTLIQQHCYVADDYLAVLKSFMDFEELARQDHIIQFPFSPVDTQQSVKEEEEVQKRRDKQRERMQEQVLRTRQVRLEAKEAELKSLEDLLKIKQEDPDDYLEHWAANGFSSEEELTTSIADLTALVQKIKNKIAGIEEPVDETPKAKPEFPLVDIPDSQLDDTQKKEKRRQRLMKAGYDAREKVRAEKEAQRQKEEEEQRIDEQKRLENPQEWLADIHVKRARLAAKIKDHHKRMEMMASRKGQAAYSRMKTIASLASGDDLTQSGRKKKRQAEDDDGFGMDDTDWLVYRDIKNEAESEDEDDQKKLDHYEDLLLQYDPQFMTDEDMELSERKNSLYHRLIHGQSGYTDPNDQAAMHQLHMNIERIRVPEIFFQPHIIGIDEAGIVENLETILSLFSEQEQTRMVQNIYVTGGCAQFPGFKERLEREIRMLRPTGTKLSVQVNGGSAWRAMSQWAVSPKFKDASITLADFERSKKAKPRQAFKLGNFQ